MTKTKSEYDKEYHEKNKEKRHAERKEKYWNGRKSYRDIPKKCTRCGSEYTSGARFQLYCPPCRVIVDRDIANKPNREKRIYFEKVCSVCDASFCTTSKNKMTCGSECSKKLRYARTYARMKERRKNEPHLAILSITRNRINDLLRKNGIKKTQKSFDLVGCSIEYLKCHIEKQFVDGMDWSNRGVHGWHIDHIRPCSSFDLSDPLQLKQCFHYTNLRPLWAVDNLKKSSRWLGPIPLAPGGGE